MSYLVLSAGAALVAFILGLIPALFWLAFWLAEDVKRPEPSWLIFFTFVAGMAAVVLVLPFQEFAAFELPMGFGLLLAWAAIEEVMKLLIVWIAVLRRPEVDEPMDFPIYLITVSLGFAALENAFFLFGPVSGGHLIESLVTGDLRFIGSALVHVLSSAVIGGALAFGYYRELPQKVLFGAIGVILAISLHAFFNFLIINSGSSGALTVFLGVWVGIVFLLLAFERVKEIERPAWWEKMFTRRINEA